MWNRLRFIRFLQVSQIFQRCKSDANKQDFENKLNLTGHAQSTPKTTGILNKEFITSGSNLVQLPSKTIGISTKVFYTYGPNLVILAWTGDELSRGQTWWRTDGLTNGQTQATTIPEGQYWPRVKMKKYTFIFSQKYSAWQGLNIGCFSSWNASLIINMASCR